MKHFLSALKIPKTFVFFLRTSSEYLERYGHGSVFKIPITDCMYHINQMFKIFLKVTRFISVCTEFHKNASF